MATRRIWRMSHILVAPNPANLRSGEFVQLCRNGAGEALQDTLGGRTGATFLQPLRLRKSRFSASSAIHSPLWEPGQRITAR